jgi:restriction endonuclease S subunit
MKLENLGEIDTGLISSRKEEQFSKNKYKIINLRTIEQVGTIDLTKADELKTSSDVERYLVDEGDVIIKVAYPFNAAAIKDIEGEKYLLSHHFCRVRLKTNRILPEYLAWYINSYNTDKFFSLITKSTIMRIPVGKLKELEIKIIPKEEQKKIIKMKKLLEEEETIINKLVEKRKELFKGYTQKLMKKHKEA